MIKQLYQRMVKRLRVFDKGDADAPMRYTLLVVIIPIMMGSILVFYILVAVLNIAAWGHSTNEDNYIIVLRGLGILAIIIFIDIHIDGRLDIFKAIVTSFDRPFGYQFY